MKKALSVSVYLLFVLNLLFPAVTLLGSFCGYAVTFVQIPALAVVLFVLSVCTVALSSVSKEATFGKVTGVLLALLAPLAIGNAVFLIFGMVKDNAWFVTVLPALCVLASAGCCCYLAARYGAPKGLKNTCLVLFAVMAIPSIFFCFLALTFGNIGVNTVVQTVASPEGGFYAEIIDNDQGALGGNTNVWYMKIMRSTPFFSRSKRSRSMCIPDGGASFRTCSFIGRAKIVWSSMMSSTRYGKAVSMPFVLHKTPFVYSA